jgi:integrase
MKRTNTAVWMEKQNRWQINVQKDGVRRSFYSSTPGRNGQREANRKADQWLDDGVQSAHVRIKEILDEYLETKKATTSKSNYNKERYHIDSFIRPVVGNKKADAITDNDFQQILYQAYRHKNKDGETVELSKKTMQNIRSTMSAIAKILRKRKLAYLNPEDWEIPKGARLKGKNILQPQDLVTLFSQSNTIFKGKVCESRYIHAYRFLVLTGMRPGEMKAISAKDAKEALSTGVLKLRSSVNVYGKETKGKNQNAIRSIVLSDLAKQEISEQLQMLPDDGTLFGIKYHDSFLRHWKRFCEYNSIPYVTPYELRHTFVSIVKTLPEGEVKPIVGHSKNMDTFGIYGHQISGERAKTTDKINAIFAELIEG